MILNTDLRLVSFKEDNQQIIAEVKSFKKIKVKKIYKLKFTVNKMNCTIFILFYKKINILNISKFGIKLKPYV